ncbi:MAG: TetR/AcrR family transcriptional regulator [Pelobium sp.]
MVEEKIKDEALDQEILKAAKQLFSKYGLKKTTMDDVAKAVGKGKSTLYYYYPGKTELFQSVINHEMNIATRLIRIAVNKEKNASAKLASYLALRLKLKEEYNNLSKVFLEDLFDHYKEIYLLKQEFEATHLDFIKEIIKGGIQSSEFKAMKEEEISFFTLWVNAAVSGLEKPGQSSICITSTQNLKQIIDYILFGIANS